MSSDNWDAYWRNAESAAAHKDGGPQDEVLEQFWSGLFDRVLPQLKGECIHLDIACGNGAVPRFALAARKRLALDSKLQVCGLDDSFAALHEMRRRDPGILAISSSAQQLAIANGSVDLVTSQFGIEYAGQEAFTDMTRVLSQGGVLALVLHLHDGGIYRECHANLLAIEAFRDTHLLENFEQLYREVVLNNDNQAEKQKIQEIDRMFASSVKAVEGILQRWGKGVASETLLRIYRDIGHMYGRLSAYDADEMFHWVEVMLADLNSYAGRMSSMLDAALDETKFEGLVTDLNECGLRPAFKDRLFFGQQNQPSAWVLVAEKTGD